MPSLKPSQCGTYRSTIPLTWPMKRNCRPGRPQHDRPFHLQTYGKTAVNYNRDIEVFPVLNRTFERILNKSPYASPTDMGVNMVGYSIVDEEAAIEASSKKSSAATTRPWLISRQSV